MTSSVSGHSQDCSWFRIPGMSCRKQIRPVIIGGAEFMDRLFPEDSPGAGPDASDA